MKRLRPLLLLGAVAIVLLGGCGGESETETGTAQPPWTFHAVRMDLEGEPDAEDAGPLLARKLGYFHQLKVGGEMLSPVHPARPTLWLNEELVNAALAREPQVVLAVDEGMPLVIVGSLISKPTMAMIWLEGSGIDSIADLKGKTIAIPGVHFQKPFLEAVLKRAGLTLDDVDLEWVGYYLESELIQGRADAIFGGSANIDGATLESRGLEPVVTPVTKLGIPGYDELVLVARRDRYTEDPELYRRLLRGMIRGNAAAMDHPGALARAIKTQTKFKAAAAENYGAAAEKATRAGIPRTVPLLSKSGEIDEAQLEHLVDWMYDEGMIKRKIPVSRLIAGEGGAAEPSEP